MKIEYLYPEICNLYGDRGNIEYLKKTTKAKVIETSLNEQPSFIDKPIDIIYLGSMTEKGQEKIISKLKPYKQKIQQLIDQGVIFLLVGNSFEIFGKYILDENDNKIEGLNIFPYYSKRFIPKRFNSLFLGNYKNIEIVGYTSRFSHIYDIEKKDSLFTIQKGLGNNPESKCEGFHKNNVFATYILGPLLVLNPLFTEQLLKLTKYKKLIYRKEAMQAYNDRLEEFKQNINFGGH